MGTKIQNLVSVEDKKEIKKSNTIIDKLMKPYLSILRDGKVHWIPDLLKEFNLPNSSNGREKLRCMNLKINSTGIVYIEKEKNGKNRGFKLKNVKTEEST